ncbi:MAG: ATP-binding protein, partial [Kiloniellales bacterium]
LREAPGAGSPSNDMGAAAGGGAHQGIGLWIVRRNLQALGGEVRAENRPEGGLTLTMRLPLAKVRPRRRAGYRAGTAKARSKRG